MQSVSSFSIHFQTAATVVAPHSYTVDIQAKPTEKGMAISINQHFFGREDLPNGEVEAEGFSADDDFTWEGELPPIWSRILAQEFDNLNLIATQPEQLEVVITHNGERKAGVPTNVSEWIFLAEQLTQACLEASGKEEPMELVLGKLEKSNFFEHARLVWYFPEQELVAEFLNGGKKVFGPEYWVESQLRMQEWLEEAATDNDLFQPPKTKGRYWLLNGSVWLQPETKGRFEALQWLVDQAKPF